MYCKDLIKEDTEDEDEDEEEEKPKSLSNATTREKINLCCLAVADCTAFMCLALMAPFFPLEVSKIPYIFLEQLHLE